MTAITVGVAITVEPSMLLNDEEVPGVGPLLPVPLRLEVRAFVSRIRRWYSAFLMASARCSFSRRALDAAAKLMRAAPATSSAMSSSVR
jgi:hypothetical protein